MLFRKKVKKKAGPIELTVDRESVCMGDDVTAPNERFFWWQKMKHCRM